MAAIQPADSTREVNKNDHLGLTDNPKLIKTLTKLRASPSHQVERVVMSDFVIKINKRDKEQTRVLLLTDRAIYNLKPNDYSSFKRRIPIQSLTAISLSLISDEFILHVPDEYDYRYKSNKKDMVADLCSSVYKQILSTLPPQTPALPSKLPVLTVAQASLKERALTKQMARVQTRDDLMKRKYLLAAEVHDSDDEEQQEILALHKAPNHTQSAAATLTQKIVSKLTNSNANGAAGVNGQGGAAGDKAVSAVENLMPNTSATSETAVKLEDFELLKVLGRGSFGKVMQVRMKTTDTIYAMKILKKKNIIARNQVEHTKSERKILQSLNHPFLMTLRYAFQSAEKLYFVLDYYQGGELFFHLKQQRRFAEETAKLYVAEIACALGYLHSISVIYRDLKPENILLDESGHVCLTDFGLSKDITLENAQESVKQATTFCGTPEYLAPEIVSGAGHDKAVDWWSLGILLYELTVGIPPFFSTNLNEMYHKIQHGILRFPPFLTDSCKSLIIGLLNRDPKKRLGSVNDLADIQQHQFFKQIDWSKLMAKQYDVPYKPKIRAIDDVSNFDATFTSEPVVDSMTNVSVSKEKTNSTQNGASGMDSMKKAHKQQTSTEQAEQAFKDFSFVPQQQ